MKKHIVSTIVLVCFGLMLVGCKKNKVDSLLKIDVDCNTTMVMKNGEMQLALVEEFGQENYSETELESFINDQISEFVKVNGEGSVKLENLSVDEEKKAHATFTYKTADYYGEFEGREIAVLTKEDASSDERVTDAFVLASEGTSITKTDALAAEDSKVVVILANNENVRVEGEVLSFNNATLVDKNTVKCGEQGYTVVVYK